MKKLKSLLSKYGARWSLGVLLTLAAALYTLGFWSSDAIERQETLISDLRMRLEPPVLDPRIVIVDIDSKSLTEVGRFPWSRNVLAKLVGRLTQRYHAATIGFDISFPEPDKSSGYDVLERLAQNDVPALRGQLDALRPRLDYDGQFAQAIAGQPVVLGYNVSDSQAKGVLPKPAFTVDELHGRELAAYESAGYEANIERLQAAARGSGSFTVAPDPDGVVRAPALMQRIGDAYYPSLALATAAVYLQARAIKPYFGESADDLSASELASGAVDHIVLATPRGLRGIPFGYGLTTIVQYRGPGGPKGGAFRYVSAADVLAGRVPDGVLKDAIVLVGTTAPGLVDLRATPASNEYPGVEVHANIIKSILDGRFKLRPNVADAAECLEVLAIGLAMSFALAVLGPAHAVLLAGAAFAFVGGLNYYLYSRQDLVLNVFPCLLLVATLFVLNLAWGYFFEFRKGRALVSRFGEYVAPELVAQMAENPAAYSMDGESRELTVMFADVRNFTTISEGLPPKELREYINIYLTAMSEEIRGSHQGTLDKYIGDAVMAFWGAPVAFPDHASRAVATALRMQASAAQLSRQFQARGWPELEIGIGLNSGLMHVGDMGSRIRRAYTVMGDAVNLGARLEGVTKVYGAGIVVGEATRLGAPEFVYRELDLVRVKGKNEPVAIFEPVGRAADVAPADLAEIGEWEQALALVRAQRWHEAQACIVALQAANRARGLYALYLRRIAHYRAHPPGAGWDGVTTFEAK